MLHAEVSAFGVDATLWYGLIPTKMLHADFWTYVDVEYIPYCPKCRREVCEDAGKFTCENCRRPFARDVVFDNAPECQQFAVEGITGFVDAGNDAWILNSPYYTYADPDDMNCGEAWLVDYSRNGVKTYCLPEDWFDEGACPYPYWRVATDELVFSPVGLEADHA